MPRLLNWGGARVSAQHALGALDDPLIPLHNLRWSRASVVALAMARSAGAQARMADAEQDFERFLQLYERDVFGYLWRMTGEEQAAYDLSQETFVRAWRHFARVTTYDQPRAWLFRVATHLALNYQRDRRVDVAALDLSAAEEQPSGALDPAGRLAERDAIEAALLCLPRRLRAALILRDVYGYRPEEIARVLKISRAAAKMTISRAREQFRAQYLHEEAGE